MAYVQAVFHIITSCFIVISQQANKQIICTEPGKLIIGRFVRVLVHYTDRLAAVQLTFSTRINLARLHIKQLADYFDYSDPTRQTGTGSECSMYRSPDWFTSSTTAYPATVSDYSAAVSDYSSACLSTLLWRPTTWLWCPTTRPQRSS
jgi:hypothetical protein